MSINQEVADIQKQIATQMENQFRDTINSTWYIGHFQHRFVQRFTLSSLFSFITPSNELLLNKQNPTFRDFHTVRKCSRRDKNITHEQLQNEKCCTIFITRGVSSVEDT